MHRIIPGSIFCQPPTGPSPPPLMLTCFPCSSSSLWYINGLLPPASPGAAGAFPWVLIDPWCQVTGVETRTQDNKGGRIQLWSSGQPGFPSQHRHSPALWCWASHFSSHSALVCKRRGPGKLTPKVLSSSNITDSLVTIWNSHSCFCLDS